MEQITSSQNPLIKEIKGLKQKKNRDDKQQFFIEGSRFVQEALKEETQILRIVISEKYSRSGDTALVDTARSRGIPVILTSDKVFADISDTENPQGILAVLEMKHWHWEELLQGRKFLLLLDSLQDPGNMGTIIRTADAAGVNGILISQGSVDVYNPKVLRSTMGSIFHVPFLYIDDMHECIDVLQQQGIMVCAAHLRGDRSYTALGRKESIAVMIGNEANGISEEAARRADVLVKIPMPGKSESLNASIAAALLMYEVIR